MLEPMSYNARLEEYEERQTICFFCDTGDYCVGCDAMDYCIFTDT